MKKDKFPYPKLNLPKEIKDKEIFNVLEIYLDLIKGYIYTDINLDHDPKGDHHRHAWLLKVVSANLIRSLYLRNAVVEAINSRNINALFLALKAWFEIVGVLASILGLLQKNLSNEDFHETFVRYALGNRGDGDFRVGTEDAISVASMIQKADKYFHKLTTKEGKDNGTQKFFTNFYDVASNPSHPSYDSYELVGSLVGAGIWKAKEPDDIRGLIIDCLPAYGGLLAGLYFIPKICQEIFEIEKEHFNQLGASSYFD